jgi:hypothetical protein
MYDGDNSFWLGDDEEAEYNEAAIFFFDNSLVIAYGDDRDITLELDNEEEKQLVKTLLADVNFWANFVNALSAAIGKHR